MSFHDGSPSSRLRHVPSDKLAARPTAKDENFQLLGLRHVLLLFFLIAAARMSPQVAQLGPPAMSAIRSLISVSSSLLERATMNQNPPFLNPPKLPHEC